MALRLRPRYKRRTLFGNTRLHDNGTIDPTTWLQTRAANRESAVPQAVPPQRDNMA